MKNQAFLIFLFAGGAVIASQPARALDESIGRGSAVACYVAAHTHESPDLGIAICDHALADDHLANLDRASTLVNRGALKVAKKNNIEAMADFEAAIRLMPDAGDAYIDRGVLLTSQHRFAEALTDINQGIGLDPSHPHLGYYDRALVEDQLGKYQDAYRDYKHTLQLEPDFTAASEQLKKYIVTRTPAKG